MLSCEKFENWTLFPLKSLISVRTMANLQCHNTEDNEWKVQLKPVVLMKKRMHCYAYACRFAKFRLPNPSPQVVFVLTKRPNNAGRLRIV